MENELQPADYSAEAALAQRVARIFGYDGLKIQVNDGGGWATMRKDGEVTLTVDPSMLTLQVIKDATGAPLSPDTKPPEQYSVYGIAHELGHVDDFLQPGNTEEQDRAMPSSEHFFWNVLDDSVINRRLRNIPLLNHLTDTVYKDILFPLDDYTDLPKHIQLMYGWLVRNVTPNRAITVSEDVEQALDGLKNVDISGKQYDMYRTLAHPDTDYTSRHSIASNYILPIYNSFLEKDRNEQQDGETSQNHDQHQQESGGTGSSEATWDEVYESYEAVSPCAHNDDDNTASTSTSESNPGTPSPHDAIKEAAESLHDAHTPTKDAQVDQISKQSLEAQEGSGDGSLAAELELSPNDAAAYLTVIETYKQQIKEVATVLQQLTIPSIEHTSPRYKRRADTDGLKLSPRDLFKVVVAFHGNTDPAIWNPVETITKKEGYSFNGLDIHLLIDSSGSMAGTNANAAAACSVMLMEGVASARRMVQRINPRAQKPDVRLQVILFGSSSRVVAPLRHETQAKDKGVTFTTARDASSGGTNVSEALRTTVRNAQAQPQRTQLVYLITDGDFSDRSSALHALEDAGNNFFLYEYILSSPQTLPITKHFSRLDDPRQMPGHMNQQLKVLATQFAE